jgi:hypothetical protein
MVTYPLEVQINSMEGLENEWIMDCNMREEKMILSCIEIIMGWGYSIVMVLILYIG